MQFMASHKSRYTSSRRYAIRINQKITKKEKEKHKGKPFRHDRQVHPRAGFVGAFPDEDP
jgi:hypothetical protein